MFISYRRDDTRHIAKIVHGRLAQHLGPNDLFMDTRSIGPGEAFPARILEAVSASEIMLVLIGQDWLGHRDGARSRIFDKQDYVAQEVMEGLKHCKRVIPVLVDGASIPNKHELPQSLHRLLDLNAIALSEDKFDRDLEDLVNATVDVPFEADQQTKESSEGIAIIIGGLATIIGAFLLADMGLPFWIYGLILLGILFGTMWVAERALSDIHEHAVRKKR